MESASEVFLVVVPKVADEDHAFVFTVVLATLAISILGHGAAGRSAWSPAAGSELGSWRRRVRSKTRNRSASH